MKKALIVGVEHYDNQLKSINERNKYCEKIASLFARNYGSGDASSEPNFSCKLLVSSPNDDDTRITRRNLKKNVKNLFEDDESDIALFYYSGYGFENSLGVHLCTQDFEKDNEGISLNDLLIYANNSNIKEVIIILDFLSLTSLKDLKNYNLKSSVLRKGVSILTSYTEFNNQKSNAKVNNFSSLIIDVLEGGHNDIFGHIKITDLYEQASRLQSPDKQKLTFKTNSSRLSTLRKTIPQVPYGILKKIITHFRGPNYRFQLSPAYVPSQGHGVIEKQKVYKELQKMAKNGLVEPVNEPHMYYAGVNSSYCKLTARGKQYWELLKKNRI